MAETKQRQECQEVQSQERVCRNRLNGSVQYFKSTQSTREGFHWPQITSTYSQSQPSSGTVELNTSTDLSLLSTTLFFLYSTREVTQKKLFCSWFWTEWAPVEVVRCIYSQHKGELEGFVLEGDVFYKQPCIFSFQCIPLKIVCEHFWAFWTQLLSMKRALVATTAQLEPFPSAFHSSICHQPWLH